MLCLIIFILSFIAIGISIYQGLKSADNRVTEAMILNIIEMSSIVVIGSIALYSITQSANSKDIPTIEFYRGNTDLKVSYIDSIPQDSIVVWKRQAQ